MASQTSPLHRPVMLKEVLVALSPREGGFYVDGTFGAGGYSRAILEAAPGSRVLAFDRDPDAAAAGSALAAACPGRFGMVTGHFSDASAHLPDRPDGVVLDIGVSSMQIDDPGRGFSFQKDGPLDMRMDRTGPTAADAVNDLPEASLARIIAAYGEEKRARAIARAIVRARATKPVTRTLELAGIVQSVIPRRHDDQVHPATRTFQALRIYVNGELEELEASLLAAETMLAPGGRLAVVAFHSLEDRIVKRFLADRSGRVARPSRHLPDSAPPAPPSFALLTSSPVTPADAEVASNPRARSAKLRAAERLDAPAHPPSGEWRRLAAFDGDGRC
ncbi:MAG TPA: 16S rRNA (cytosine(1402)-N(4))-methyltransferase RsmH [Aestuariivirgaceae bacterium]|nr:16S rRNA (cytosine(1402)-N(4))-methyltransferase RsmH [Aestuariivirgaceae bacterium]